MTSELFRLVFALTLFLPFFSDTKKRNRNFIDEWSPDESGQVKFNNSNQVD